MDWMVSRFIERTKTRKPEITQDLVEIFERYEIHEHPTALFLDYLEGKESVPGAHQKTQAIREYMLQESSLQYKDYFESDPEE